MAYRGASREPNLSFIFIFIRSGFNTFGVKSVVSIVSSVAPVPVCSPSGKGAGIKVFLHCVFSCTATVFAALIIERFTAAGKKKKKKLVCV